MKLYPFTFVGRWIFSSVEYNAFLKYDFIIFSIRSITVDKPM